MNDERQEPELYALSIEAIDWEIDLDSALASALERVERREPRLGLPTERLASPDWLYPNFV